MNILKDSRLLAKQEVENLNKHIFEIDVHHHSLLNVSQEEVPVVKHYVSVAKCEPRRGTLSKTLC